MTATAGKLKATANVTISKGETPPPPPPPLPSGLTWEGQVPAQKWMNFYTKVLARFAANRGLRLTVRFELDPEAPISPQKIEETRVALRELGLDDDVRTQ